MTELDPKRNTPAPVSKKPLLNPYVAIALSIVLDACGQVLLKVGADHSVAHNSLVGITALKSWWTWLGIITMVTSFSSWIYSLKFIPLNIAANLTGSVHVLVPLICWTLLGEEIHLQRWLGIATVIVGVCVVARPLMTVEEKMEKGL